jgi:Tfp pilus assembly protein PilO
MKRSLFITSIIFGIIILVGFIFLVLQIRGTILQTQAVQKQFAEEQQKTKQIESLRIVARDIESIEEKLQVMYIEEQHIIDFIKELELIATQENVVLSLSQLDIIKDKEPYLLMSVDFRGSFDQVSVALRRFELLPYIIHIDQVQITPYEEEGVENQWRLVITSRLVSFIPEI